MDRKQTIKSALDIVRANVYTVECAWNEGVNPTEKQIEAFEKSAKDVIDQATEAQLEEVYDEVLASADPSEPISPATLLCWLGDSVSDIEGLTVYSINLETDR